MGRTPDVSVSSRSATSSRDMAGRDQEANPTAWTFAELLSDCEEDRTLRAVLVGMLREAKR